MRKVLFAALVAALALSAGSASAVEENVCLISGGETTPGDGVETCTFEAADAPAHGYVGATPNDFIIFIDVDGDGNLDGEDTLLAEVSPSEFNPIAGQFSVEAGATVSVNLSHGCAGPACGWAGALLVG